MAGDVDSLGVNGVGLLHVIQQLAEEADVIRTLRIGAVAPHAAGIPARCRCDPLKAASARSTVERIGGGIDNDGAPFFSDFVPAAVFGKKLAGAGKPVHCNDQRIALFQTPLVCRRLEGVPIPLQAIDDGFGADHPQVRFRTLRFANVGIALAAPALIILDKSDKLFDHHIAAQLCRSIVGGNPDLGAGRVVDQACAGLWRLAVDAGKTVVQELIAGAAGLTEKAGDVGLAAHNKGRQRDGTLGNAIIAVGRRIANQLQQRGIKLCVAPGTPGCQHRGVQNGEYSGDVGAIAKSEAVDAGRVAGKVFH